jgi:hypothetical protein
MGPEKIGKIRFHDLDMGNRGPGIKRLKFRSECQT